MEEQLRTFKALGDSTRLKIVKLLSGADEVCVCEIMSSLGLNQAAASKALGVLKKAGIVNARRDGRWMHYSMARKGDGFAVKAAGLILSGGKTKKKMRCV